MVQGRVDAVVDTMRCDGIHAAGRVDTVDVIRCDAIHAGGMMDTVDTMRWDTWCRQGGRC